MVHDLGELSVNKARRFHDDERGVIAVMVALMLKLMLGILALVMDLGNARQQRREAQNSADAAALAGAEVIEAGGATLTWTSVVDQVKKYARANDDVATSAWVGCTDANALPYHPDSGNNNACISADLSSWPAPSAATVGNTANRLRVHFPSLVGEDASSPRCSAAPA